MKRLLVLAMGATLWACGSSGEKAFTSADRAAHKTEIRKAFLDDGMEVTVEVRGPEKDTLVLENVLFNDVWDRKFETQGDYDDWSRMGFKQVILKDGHDTYEYKRSLQIYTKAM